MPDPANQPASTDATQDGAPIAPPPTGEQTTAQSVFPGLPGGGGIGVFGPGFMPGCGDGRPYVVSGGWYGDRPTLWSGGTFGNPCAFPGWGGGYPGSYWTYRFMLQCYKLRLARAAAVSPVIESGW